MPEHRLTVKQVAEQLGTGVLTVYRRIWAGEIEAIDMRMSTGERPTYRVNQSALDAYLQQRQIIKPLRRVA